MKNKYEICVNVLNEEPPQQLIDDFDYTIVRIIDRILEGGGLNYENK
jgi:hypothetical protein